MARGIQPTYEFSVCTAFQMMLCPHTASNQCKFPGVHAIIRWSQSGPAIRLERFDRRFARKMVFDIACYRPCYQLISDWVEMYRVQVKGFLDVVEDVSEKDEVS